MNMGMYTIFLGFCILVLGVIVGRLLMAIQYALMKPKKKRNFEAERIKRNLELINAKEKEMKQKEDKFKEKQDELNNKILKNEGRYYVSITSPLHSQPYYHRGPYRRI